MMTDAQITEKIIKALADYLKKDPASITEAHHLRDDLGLDSMAVIELLFEIEDAFKIQIPDQDLPGLSTVGSVADYVKERLASPASAAKKPAAAKPAPARTPKKRTPAVSSKRVATTKKKKKVTNR
jgi:acyl carrier protein